MYTIEEIKKLQYDKDFRIDEGDRYCLVSPQGKELTKDIAHNQANFCILQTLKAYDENNIDGNRANFIINKIDAIIYSLDMLGVELVIHKLNKEIIEEELYAPHFNYICILCDDLYAGFE